MHNFYDALPSMPAVGLQRDMDLWVDDAAFCQITLTSCSNRVVSTWNSLPNWVVSGTADNTDTFKTRLDKFWYKQDTVYDFRAQLQGTGSQSEILY